MKKKSSVKKSKIYGKYFVVTSVLVLIGLFLYTNFFEKSVFQKDTQLKTKETTFYYPAPYSDKKITENAIVSDQKFTKTYPFEREKLLSNVISSTGTVVNISSVEPENGTWLWTDTLKITPDYRKTIINSAKNNGIKNIYLSVDTYLDIFVMPNGKEKEENQKKFDDVLRGFISEAKRNGLTVDAEAGWRNWAEEGNTYKAFAVLDYVVSFNSKYKEKFRGIQYDIEPYLLEKFERNNKKIMSNFVGLVDRITTKLNGNNLQLSFVIPEFYDGTFNRTSKFVYGWKYTYAFDHMVDILDKRPGSKIIVMSYRNYSKGEDGSIEISQYEISNTTNHKTKVIIAQEVGDVEPSYVTFHNMSKKYYESQVGSIKKAFETSNSFGGVATHYINAMVELN